MTMTRQDFEAVARAMRQAQKDAVLGGLGEPTRLYLSNVLVPALAAELATTNPRFDIERFVQACNQEAP